MYVCMYVCFAYVHTAHKPRHRPILLQSLSRLNQIAANRDQKKCPFPVLAAVDCSVGFTHMCMNVCVRVNVHTYMHMYMRTYVKEMYAF